MSLIPNLAKNLIVLVITIAITVYTLLATNLVSKPPLNIGSNLIWVYMTASSLVISLEWATIAIVAFSAAYYEGTPQLATNLKANAFTARFKSIPYNDALATCNAYW